MLNLAKRKCKPCEGGMKPLLRKQFEPYLTELNGWIVIENDTKIRQDYTFKNFVAALAFVNAVGEIAESEGHHPDIYIHDWCRVQLTLNTHAIGGLSENDFVVAAKIDQIKL